MTEVDAKPLNAVPIAIFKKRTIKAKSNIRKRPTSPPAQAQSDAEESYSSEDDAGHRVKRRKKGGVTVSSSTGHRAGGKELNAAEYTADANAVIDVTNDATRHSNWYDETAKDALSSKKLLGSSKSRNQSTVAKSNGATQPPDKEPERKVGPVKAPANVRTITITDMAPDGESTCLIDFWRMCTDMSAV